MRKFYSAFRIFVHIVIFSIIAIYTLGYILLSIPNIQDKVRHIGIKELSAILDTNITIDRIQISPFNKLELFGAYIPDLNGDTLLYANKISAGISLSDLLVDRELVFTNIQLFGLDARITKETPSSETNLQFIIDAFKSDKNTPKKKINFKINNAIIRRGKIKYDILSAPIRRGQFDPNHIDLRNLLSKLSIKALSEDSVNISIKRLGFDEQSGFSLNRLQFKFEANRQQARLSDFKIQLPHSRIEIKPIIATLPDTLSAEQFYDQTRFSLQITKSLINPSDIAAFIPVLEKINTPILISMHLTGTPNNLYFHTFDFNFGKEDIIAHSQISVKNITNPQKRDILCDPITLNASSSGLADISSKLPFLTEEQCKTISRLGTIHFTGNISSQNKNLTACGTLETDLGSVHSDISINQNNSLNTTQYSGLIESKKFNLNGLFAEGNPYGEIIFKVELDSKKAKHQAPTGKVVGGISHFEYKGYPYENIMLNGEFGDNRYNGIIEINDPNGKLRVNGLSVLKDKDSEFDLILQARDLNVSALKLMPKYKNSKLGFNVVAKFTGNNLDNAEGLLSIDSLSFTNNDDTFRLNKFNIEAHNQNTPQSIAVTSDYINGWIEGNYKFSTLQKSLQTLLSESLPSIFPFQENQPKKTEHKKINNRIILNSDLPSSLIYTWHKCSNYLLHSQIELLSKVK